jgi:uncharacterized protein
MSDALLEAIQTRDVDRVAALLAAGADPNKPGKSRYGRGADIPPLEAAIDELQAFEAIGPYGPEPAGPIDLVVLLLRHGARASGWGTSNDEDPLWDAVRRNNIEAVRLLLTAGAEINLKDDEGRSPLRICVEKEYLEMARLLLLCGASKTINEAVAGGMTALGLAAYWLNVDMVRLLLAHGADPRVEDADRRTVFDHLRSVGRRVMDSPEDPADQDRLREIRRLLGDPPA